MNTKAPKPRKASKTKPVKVTLYVDAEVYKDLIASSNGYDRSPSWLLGRLWSVRPAVSPASASAGRRHLTRKITAYLDPAMWDSLQAQARRYDRTPSWLLDCTWCSLRAWERHELWITPNGEPQPQLQHEAAP